MRPQCRMLRQCPTFFRPPPKYLRSSSVQRVHKIQQLYCDELVALLQVFVLTLATWLVLSSARPAICAPSPIGLFRQRGHSVFAAIQRCFNKRPDALDTALKVIWRYVCHISYDER